MTEYDARKRAQETGFEYMCHGDIKIECIKRWIKVIRNRTKMEFALIDSLTKEYMSKT